MLEGDDIEDNIAVIYEEVCVLSRVFVCSSRRSKEVCVCAIENICL